MTYTALNIENIKRDGNFSNYIEMERALVAKLSAAEIVETTTSEGAGEMSIAHLRGYWSASEDCMTEKRGTFVSDTSLAGLDWAKEWNNFQTMNAARQYARAALRNHLTQVASEILSAAKARLAALEAA